MDDKTTKLILNSLNQINVKLDKHDEYFKAINSRLDKHDECFKEMRIELDSHNENFKIINDQLTSLGNIVTRIEVEHGEKIQIALEYISTAIKQHKEMQKTLNQMNSRLNNHEMRIEILEEKVL